MSEPAAEGVALRDGESGSTLLHRILGEAQRRWPAAFEEAALPGSPGAFRKRYGEALAHFELARLASAERLEIGRFVVERAGEALVLGGRPLAEALSAPGEPLRVDSIRLPGKGGLAPSVPYRGRDWSGAALSELGALLAREDLASLEVEAALAWLVANGLDDAGEIALTDRRFAVLGAGAEIAPTRLLLAAGAEVLWIDVAPVPEALVRDETLSGRLLVPQEPANLLARPDAIAATLRQYAEAGPIDLGLYAYAPGRGQEWRLTGTMNALVDSLPAGSVRSVGLLVSPTTPVALRPETVRAAERRLTGRKAWQRALEGVGVLRPGRLSRGDVHLLRNVVSVQGAGYQAAQYVGKTLAAERWATVGPRGTGPVPVSATVAAITLTRSLRHPVFEAAFGGAAAFDVETWPPETTRALNALLLIHDLLDPAAPGAVPGRTADAAARARDLMAEQVHGGFFAVPWELDPAIQAAALMGLARRPGLLPGFVRGILGR